MKMNLTRLQNIAVTLGSIAEIEKCLEWYADTSKVDPAYVSVRAPAGLLEAIALQIDRQDFVDFMQSQKEKLIKNLEDRFDGFQYDPDAQWSGDR